MGKNWLKASAIGVVIPLLALFMPVLGFAQDARETQDTSAPAIQIYVDGVLVTPADGSAESAAPLLRDGTVYLPIGALSEALGKPVEWDSATNSVHIGSPAEIEEITVSTAAELIAALGSNRRILLEEGVYNLTAQNPGYMSGNIYYGDMHDGWELFLEGVHNLTIEGIGDAQSEIIVEPRYANVLNFLNCTNISLVNIKAGHTEAGTCSGGVFYFEKCSNIQIENTDMYGCGAYGLWLENVRGATITGSTIYECTSEIMLIQRSSDISFVDCVFRDNAAASLMVAAENTSGLVFDSCAFLRNAKAPSMFSLSGSEGIVVTNTEFIDNKVPVFASRDQVEVDASSRFENNLFDASR